MHNPGPPHRGQLAGDFSVSADEVTCREFVDLVTDYWEGALAPRMLSQVEEHLVMCDWCVTYLEQMETTITALHELQERPVGQPPDSLLAALRAKRAAGE